MMRRHGSKLSYALRTIVQSHAGRAGSFGRAGVRRLVSALRQLAASASSGSVWDLTLVLLLALAAVVIVLAWPGLAAGRNILVGILGLLLALVLPGYAVTAAAFPRGALRKTELVALTLGLSVVLSILLGLVLDGTSWGLQTRSWALGLGAITLLADGIAMARRRPGGRRAWSLPALAPSHLIMFGLAAALLVASLNISRAAVVQQPSQPFTQLWALPESGSVRLGVRNEEGQALQYDLRVLGNGQVIREWQAIKLDSGEQWDQLLPLTPQQSSARIDVRLYRTNSPQTVYREVWLSAERPPAATPAAP